MNSQNKSSEFWQRCRGAIPRGVYHITDLVVATASGALLRDIEGHEFLDFSGGIGVLNVGHSHPKVVQAVEDQALKFTHTCFHVVAYELYLRLVERLIKLVPGSHPKKGMLTNSGAEAVENAVKIARHWTGRQKIVCFDHAFHGRTLLTMSLTSKVDPYKQGFGSSEAHVCRSHYASCYSCPLGTTYPDCEVRCLDDGLGQLQARGILPTDVAAVIVEPILGEGGFMVPPREFFPRIRDWCTKHGVVFIVDEVQTGFGRTGKMFAIEHWDVEPDLVVLAKSIAGGLPLSAVVGNAEIMDSPQEGGLGGTYGGNPLACAAALAVLKIFEEEKLLEQSVKIGRQLRRRLLELQRRYSAIGDVRGLGAMMAVELVQDPETRQPDSVRTKALLTAARQRGLILLKCGTHDNVIRFLLPLNTPAEQVQRGLEILSDSLAEVFGNQGSRP